MKNLSEKDPIKDAIFDLEIIEYDLRRAVQVLLNLSVVHDDIPDDVHYLIDRIWDHSEAVTNKYHILMDAWRAQNHG